ncbi:MAG: hypothetical protein IPL61_10650 [Myxococcales bacterium]|nr:hypothetical protein [Myxococcales bacterium]
MPGAARGRTLATLALAVAVMATGCYRPNPGECQLACTPASGCPAALTCGSDGFCHGGGDTFACGGDDAPAPDAGDPDAPGDDAREIDAMPPSPIEDLAAGNRHACAIRAGVLACWGDNRRGQLGVTLSIKRTGTPIVVGSATDWEHVAAGQNHTCGIRAGVVWCFGSNTSGQTGAMVSMSSTPSQVKDGAGAALTGATALCTGAAHSCAIVAGALMCWGSDAYGQLGDGPAGDGGQRAAAAEVLTAGSRTWTDVACGVNHTCAVASDHAVYCWGENANGMLGRAVTGVDNDEPTDVTVLAGAARVAIGDTYSCAITTTSGLSCWGYYNDAAHPAPVSALPSGLSGVSALSAARDGACASDGTTTRCFGDGSDGELGDGSFAYRRTYGGPVQGAPGVERLASGTRFHCAALVDGSIRCWGKNSDGQLGQGTTATAHVRVQVPGVWRTVATGKDATCAIAMADQRVYCWGQNFGGWNQPGPAALLETPTLLPDVGPALDVAVGSEHACAVALDGTVSCWGEATYGRVGNGSVAGGVLPPTVVSDGGGALHASELALADHGSQAAGPSGLFAWGENAGNRLGLPTVANQGDAQPVDGSPLWTSPGLGANFGCGLRGGVALCWGGGDQGQLGTGASAQSGPVAIPGFTFSAIAPAAFGDHVCAVTSGVEVGALFCWGDNARHQGSPLASGSPSPRRQGTAVDWSAVAAGSDTSCGVRGGSLECWGANDEDSYQAGLDRDPGDVTSPTAIGTGFSAVSLGWSHGCALTATGELWCWGNGRYGAIGLAGHRDFATAQPVTLP